jgi:hypothetical protein
MSSVLEKYDNLVEINPINYQAKLRFNTVSKDKVVLTRRELNLHYAKDFNILIDAEELSKGVPKGVVNSKDTKKRGGYHGGARGGTVLVF